VAHFEIRALKHLRIVLLQRDEVGIPHLPEHPRRLISSRWIPVLGQWKSQAQDLTISQIGDVE